MKLFHKKKKILNELFPLTLNIETDVGEVVFSSKINTGTFRRIFPELIASEIVNVQPMTQKLDG